MKDAMQKHPEVDVMVNFASLRSAYDSTIEAMNFSQVCVTYPPCPSQTSCYCCVKRRTKQNKIKWHTVTLLSGVVAGCRLIY